MDALLGIKKKEIRLSRNKHRLILYFPWISPTTRFSLRLLNSSVSIGYSTIEIRLSIIKK